MELFKMGNDEHGPAYPEPPDEPDTDPYARLADFIKHDTPVTKHGWSTGDEAEAKVRAEQQSAVEPKDDDSIPAKLSEGEYSVDGGQTWLKGSMQDALLAAINQPKHSHATEFVSGVRRGYARSKGWPWVRQVLVAAITALIVSVTMVTCHQARAMDHGFNPNDPTVRWFQSKMRPDEPSLSCCGKGEAYPVARYQENPNHSYTVWLADGSALKYPDGATRAYFDMATPITVPKNKVNDPIDDLDNPTDVSWVFMTVSTPTDVRSMFCFIRHPEGN
jgi:hypothetical protein